MFLLQFYETECYILLLYLSEKSTDQYLQLTFIDIHTRYSQLNLTPSMKYFTEISKSYMNESN